MPATEPLRFSQSSVDDKCQDGGGILDPAWITVFPTITADDYASGSALAGRLGIPSAGPNIQAADEVQAVEGFVSKALISSGDNRLNHASQDFIYNVRLDPIHRRFLYASEDRDPRIFDADGNVSFVEMHNKWEIEPPRALRRLVELTPAIKAVAPER